VTVSKQSNRSQMTAKPELLQGSAGNNGHPDDFAFTEPIAAGGQIITMLR